MSENHLLRKVHVGPRTGINPRKGKDIRVDEDGFERYSDFFSETSGDVRDDSVDVVRKSNKLRRSKLLATKRNSQMTLPSLSPFSLNDMTNTSTRMNGMIRRSMRLRRSDNVGVVNPNNAHVHLRNPGSGDLETDKDEDLHRISDALQQKSRDAAESSNVTNVEAANRENVESSVDETSLVGLPEVVAKSRSNKEATLVDNQVEEEIMVEVEEENVPETNDDQESDDQVNVALQSSEHGNSKRTNSTVASSRQGTSASTNRSKKVKKRKKLFMDRKIRKRSLTPTSRKEREINEEESLNLSPIFPAQKRNNFAASTPAVNKSRRLPRISTLTENVTPVCHEPLEPRPGTSNYNCPPSCDPLLIPQNTKHEKKRPRKSVTFISPVKKGEKTSDGQSTVLPSFTTAEPLHYYETTIKNDEASQKRKIFYPEADEETGLRKSKRTRAKPLEWYRNERLKYRWTDNGWSIVGITTPQKSPGRVNRVCRFVKRMARQADNEERAKRKEAGELSIHVPVDENLLQQRTNVIELVDFKTKNLISQPCFFKYNQYTKISCQTKLPAEDDDPVVMMKPLQVQHFSSGHLEIRPLEQKKLQFLKADLIWFVITKGKVEVTIHQSSFVLETNDMFYVLPENVYGIRNLRNEDAHLVFLNLKNYADIVEHRETSGPV